MPISRTHDRSPNVPGDLPDNSIVGHGENQHLRLLS